MFSEKEGRMEASFCWPVAWLRLFVLSGVSVKGESCVRFFLSVVAGFAFHLVSSNVAAENV